MNSIKTTIVCVVLLGVLYGMYQVINTPTPNGLENDELALSLESEDQIGPQQRLQELEQENSSGDMHSNAPSMLSPTGDGSPQLRSPDFGNPSNQLRSRADSIDNDSQAIPNDRPPSMAIHSNDTSQAQPSRTGTSSGLVPANNDIGLPPPSADARNAQATSVDQTWASVESLVAENRLAEALRMLSRLYGDTRLTEEEQRGVQTWLDALAAKVIYSSEHHLQSPFVVGPGDSIERIAADHEVPVELLANINASRFQQGTLSAGSEIKIVRGPFSAVVDVPQQSMTLWLDDMYAGKFPVYSANPGMLPAAGTYRVADRSNTGRDFIAPNVTTIPRMTPSNPYGNFLIDLGQGILIHELSSNPTAQAYGCIGLQAADAQDVYSILSRNSEVTVIR